MGSLEILTYAELNAHGTWTAETQAGYLIYHIEIVNEEPTMKKLKVKNAWLKLFTPARQAFIEGRRAPTVPAAPDNNISPTSKQPKSRTGVKRAGAVTTHAGDIPHATQKWKTDYLHEDSGAPSTASSMQEDVINDFLAANDDSSGAKLRSRDPRLSKSWRWQWG